MSGPTPPLKRHVALQPFSRDHYAGLVQAQRLLKTARDADSPDLKDRRDKTRIGFLQAWDEEIEAHFADEEELLIPLMNKEERHQLEMDHTVLRDLAKRGRALPEEELLDPDWFQQTGSKLETHIRWEERVLFPQIQERITQEEAGALMEQTQRIEESRARNACRKP
jgi:iron-sulfur cluster repair protein YtfE (RIC family)